MTKNIRRTSPYPMVDTTRVGECNITYYNGGVVGNVEAFHHDNALPLHPLSLYTVIINLPVIVSV